MAVAATHLTTAGSTTDGTSVATASITPTANRLVLGLIVHTRGSDAPIPTASGCGLTWVQVDTQLYPSGSTTRRMTLFRALGASPSAGAVTFDFGGSTQTSFVWSISEFAGIDTSGTNGSGAIGNTAKDVGTAVTSLTVTLPAFGSVNNATFGAIAIQANAAITEGSGFAMLGQAGTTASVCAGGAEFRADNDTTVDASWASTNAGLIAVEIVAAAAAGGWGPLLDSGRNRLVVG